MTQWLRTYYWRTFLALQVVGCLLLVVATNAGLLAYVAGLVILLPGSLVVSYPLSLLDTRQVHGWLLNDALYLPLACLVNALVWKSFQHFRKVQGARVVTE